MYLKLLQHKHLVLISFLLCAIAIFAFFVPKSEEPKHAALDNNETAVTRSTDNPSEDKPDNYKWSGGATDPKFIRLPSIATEGFIQRVAVDQKDQMAVPTNIHLAGWFVNSVRPGEQGLSIIDGHVDGKTTEGIFKRLGLLKTDDEFTVELGNAEAKTYRVKQVVTTTASEAANVLYSQDPTISSQLNLITCGGAFDRDAGYDKRIIVVSEYIGS